MDRLDRIARKVASGGSGRVRTAGKIEFIRDQGPIRRDIRVKGFQWTPECLSNLAKILWAAQRAHSYAISAYRLFSKMPSAEFSPDGMLGGRGYIQNVKDMRGGLSQAVEVLSAFTDTVHDEVNADHWKTSEEAMPSVQPIVEDAEQVKADPGGFVEEEYDEVASGQFDEDAPMNPDAGEMNPIADPEAAPEEEESDPTFSQMATKLSKRSKTPEAKLPSDDSEQKQGKTEVEMVMHTTTPDHGAYAAAIARVLKSHESRTASRRAGGDSAIPQSTLPGPRVERTGPGENDPEWGSDDPAGNMMGGGTNQSSPLMDDWCADGVSGYEDATSGDSSVLAIAGRVAGGYSWLPGADNTKMMPYYDRSVTPEQDAWMRANNQPDVPKGVGPQEHPRPRMDHFWEDLRN